MDTATYCIAITFRDDANNKFVTLGGAGWETEEEWNAAWGNIPAVDINDPAHCIADKRDANWDIVDDRCVSAETVEALLGKPIQQLIKDAT